MPYNGTYYNGMVYNYTDVFAELPTYFWYITAADDERPIEQACMHIMHMACVGCLAIETISPVFF